MKIKVYDAMMGSGKTTKLIEDIAGLPADAHVIYITPLLTECHRVAGTSYDEEDEYKRPLVSYVDQTDQIEEYIYDPQHPLADRRFRHPGLSEGSKMETLLFQVKHGCNIVSTHALFRNINPAVVAEVKNQEYILVLDEVLSIYEEFKELQLKEVEQLFKNEILSLADDGLTLRFNKERFGETENTRYQEIADLCEMKQLMLVDGKVVVWEFPISALQAFKEVWIGTYLFNGSQMAAYLRSHNIVVEVHRFGKKPSEIKHLIRIEDSKVLNKIGEGQGSLSHHSITVKKTHNEQLRKNLNTFFRSKHKTKIEDRLWTVYKSASREISGGRFAKSWLACGTKATNDWKDTWCVAYLINLFVSPMIMKLLAQKEANMDQSLYSLSEMVQFIWRSRIRNGEPIDLYVPSKRMRELLVAWLNDEFEEK